MRASNSESVQRSAAQRCAAQRSAAQRSAAQRSGGRLLWLLAGLALITIACQTVVGLFGGEAAGPRFPHAIHVEEGLDCSGCHLGSEEEDYAGLPETANGCMLCHSEIDEGKPVEQTVAAFVVDDKPIWLGQERDYGKIRFSHGAHYEADLDCETCHQEVLDGTGPGLQLRGGKPTCLACHETTERGAEDCSVCHTDLRHGEAPPDHTSGWLKLHGDASRTLILGMGETTCAQCHEENTCVRCHQEEKPQSHNHFWRIRGHGLTAAIDRGSCETCHTTDSCVRCHQSTPPRSHRGAWGQPGNRHCNGCHLQAPRAQGCTTCHFDFPPHPPGLPLPGSLAHMTARSPTDCLACHVVLSHANPGGDCRICHR